MWKMLKHRLLADREDGQALVLLALGVVGFVGMCAMAIDVGRLLWARNQIQAAVDSAVLAGAQSMPVGTSTATTQATYYWDANNDFLQAQGTNVNFNITFPTGNKAIKIDAEADIPTWFAGIFGISNWHVTASGTAASQVLDIALVMDVSGSMCFTSTPQVENTTQNVLMSPGRLTPSGGAFPKLTAAIPSSGPGTNVVIYLNDVSIFNSTNQANNKNNFGYSSSSYGWDSTTKYWQRDFDGGTAGRAGMIRIDQELMQITNVNAAANTLTVTRARTNNDTGVATVQQAHGINSEVWANRMANANGKADYCDAVSKYTATSAPQDGPHQPFDDAISNAKYFISLFNGAYDKVGLASYSTTAKNQNALTGTFSSLNSKLDGSGATEFLHPNGSTNIAHGLGVGQQILDGTGKRANAVRILVLVTDGIPNKYCTNSTAYTTTTACTTGSTADPSACPATSNTSISHAIARAAAAKAADITVYTIGLGDGVLDCILNDIAVAGGGTYYKAPTGADLDTAFAAIAAKTHIALTQ